jgi:hypothetical protein
MRFHEPAYRDFGWLETNWFSWMVPDAKMRSHVRCGFRVNLNTVETSVFVFSCPRQDAWLLDVDHVELRWQVPMPPHSLANYKLPNGLAVRMTEPLKRWELRYVSGDGTLFDLEYRSLMPPVHVSEIGTAASARTPIPYDHIEQTMMVEGSVRVSGTEFSVHCASQRDHSWGNRPDGATRGGAPGSASNFDEGHFGENLSFSVVSVSEWDHLSSGVVTNGYILDHGELLRLKAGTGHYLFSDNGWVITRLRYELEDERGRTHVFRGEPVSFYDKVGYAGTIALVRWEAAGGEVGWGEYNWHGDMYEMQILGRPTP